MQRQGYTYDEMEARSGVLRPTLKAWRYKNSPSLTNLEACMNVLGFDFIAIPRSSVLPPAIVAELRPIADKLGLEMPAAIRALVEIAVGLHAKKAAPKPRQAPKFRQAQAGRFTASVSRPALLSMTA